MHNVRSPSGRGQCRRRSARGSKVKRLAFPAYNIRGGGEDVAVLVAAAPTATGCPVGQYERASRLAAARVVSPPKADTEDDDAEDEARNGHALCGRKLR